MTRNLKVLSQVQVKRVVKYFSFSFPSATEQVSGARDPVWEVCTELVFPMSARNWTSSPATMVTCSTSHVMMTVFSERLGGPRSCQSTTAMTSMGEFPHFLQSWGQSPPPVTHLINWARQLGWRLGHVSMAFLDLVFRVPRAKTCSLSGGSLLGVLLE